MRKKIQNSMFMVVAASLLVAYAITILFMYGKIRGSRPSTSAPRSIFPANRI